MNFSFVHLSDHHLLESETALRRGFSPAYAFRAVLRHIAATVGSRIDFIVCGGDLVEPATAAAYQAFKDLLGLETQSAPPGPQLATVEGLRQIPIYFLPGNHDDRALFVRQLFPGAEPAERLHTAFQHKGVKFICPDWGPDVFARADPQLFPFLSQALQGELPVVILTHHAMVRVGARWLDNFLTDDVDEFWKLITAPGVRKRILGILSGHTHLTYEQVVKGLPVYGVRSTAFPFARSDHFLMTLEPPHYRLVAIQDGLLTTRVFEVPL